MGTEWLPDPATPSGWRWTGDDPDGMDAQSRAYRLMTPDDVVLDDSLTVGYGWVSLRHDPLPTGTAPDSLLLTPDDHDAAGWDAGRTDPRPT